MYDTDLSREMAPYMPPRTIFTIWYWLDPGDRLVLHYKGNHLRYGAGEKSILT